MTDSEHGHELTVGRGVIAELVGLAALEVPGIVRIDGVRVRVRLWVVARPGQEIRPLAAQVGSTVAATVERLLGLELADVTVVVDGVGN